MKKRVHKNQIVITTLAVLIAVAGYVTYTAQNTTGVTAIMESTPEFLGEQLESIFTDIYPDAVKIGMVSSSSLIKTISDKLKKYDAKNIVVDPVMVATSGAKLISDEAVSTLKEHLFPLATVLTPNIPEAEVLSEMKISNEEEMIKAAEIISEKYGCAVLCKGGHQINDANDLLFKDGTTQPYFSLIISAAFIISSSFEIFISERTSASGIFGVRTVASGKRCSLRVLTASSLISFAPLVATITGSTTIFFASYFFSLSEIVFIRLDEETIPIFTASG